MQNPITTYLPNALIQRSAWTTWLIAGLLAAHTLRLPWIHVDVASVLLVTLLVLPRHLRRYLRGGALGDVAIVPSQRVEQMALFADRSLPDVHGLPEERPNICHVLRELEVRVKHDPVAALSHLTLELERIIKRLWTLRQATEAPPSPSSPLPQLDDLACWGMITQEQNQLARAIFSICIDVTHGWLIRPADAARVLDIGGRWLTVVYNDTKTYAVGDPVQECHIDPFSAAEFEQAQYRVTTVIPFRDEPPTKQVRIMNHEGARAYLDGYSGASELLVEVCRVDRNAPVSGERLH